MQLQEDANGPEGAMTPRAFARGGFAGLIYRPHKENKCDVGVNSVT